MKSLAALLFLMSFPSLACVEVMENKRVSEMTYNFYANNGKDSCIRLPHIRKDFEPQGLHITDQSIAYISMHHKEKKLASRVVQADARTGKVLKTYELMSSTYRSYTGQASSLAVFDGNTKFIVPSGQSLCFFDKRNAKRLENGIYRAPLLSCQKQDLGVSKKIAFISYGKDHRGEKYIWAVGSKGHQDSKIKGYKISRGKILKSPSYTNYKK